jgi:hypothetical protein
VGWKLAGETEVLGENLPQRHSVHHKIPHDQTRARTPDRRGGKPATNRFSYGAAIRTVLQQSAFSELNKFIWERLESVKYDNIKNASQRMYKCAVLMNM